MGGQSSAGQLGALIPWCVGFVPFALADAAIVWVALRRLGGGARPALGGFAGVLTLAGVAVAVDLVENAPDVVGLLIPPAATQILGSNYDVVMLIVETVWLGLWLPALAVAVAERTGGPTSLGRGLGLTSGHRWTLITFILGLQFIALVLAYAVGFGLVQLGLGWVPNWTIDLATLPIWAVSSSTQAVAYWELTRLKTGIAPAAVADLFD
jgi:hypothetical protein